MAGITSLGGVGAGLSQAQFQVQYQGRVLKEQQQVTQSLGNAALELLRTAMSSTTYSGAAEYDLDVQA